MLKGTEFIEHWREDSVNGLFTRIKTSMPARNAGSLTDEMFLDIVTYILQSKGYPAGDNELKLDTLKAFRITNKEGPSAVPDFALVRMIGCLTQAADKSWALTNASTPTRTRDPGQPPAAELKTSAAAAPGSDTYKLLDVDSFRTGFSPDAFKGQKMEAKGFLIRKPELRLSVTWLEPVDSACPQ